MRSVSLGNGHMLLLLDQVGHVQDLYFPYVGLENHIGRHSRHRLGVYVDGQLHWMDDPSWHIEITLLDDTLTSNIEAKNEKLKVKLTIQDTLFNEKNIFVRKIKVHNTSDDKRTIKVYFNHEFKINESGRGDTAYYDPSYNALFHYKGRRVFMMNAMVGDRGIDDYTVGQYGLPGQEGTFRDAEDGVLSKNAIRHGKVDSTCSISLELGYQEEETIHYWMCVATSVQDACELNAYVLEHTADYIVQTTQDYWSAWVNKQQYDFQDLKPNVVDLFKKSLLILRTHIDNNGSILASGDTDMLHHGFDTYGYLWPRDGALTSIALIDAGYVHTARHFFEFCESVIAPGGYLLHKYRPDGSLGSSWHPLVKNGAPSLPIQEDETALTIYALWRYYEEVKDLEFIENVYSSLIEKAADFMADYIHPKTNLPLPSYDLWEEKHGTSTFTAAAVVAGLRAASQFASILGKQEAAHKYENAADRVKNGIMTYLYNPDDGFFKLMNMDDTKITYDKTTDISSFYALFAFDILDLEDERMHRMANLIEERIICNTKVGGVCRYEGDYYYRASYDCPGNPWILTSLWWAQYYIKKAKSEYDLAPVKFWLDWVTKHALPSGSLPEQLHPFTGEPICATPLMWSHAEYISTVVYYLAKLRELDLSASREKLNGSLSPGAYAQM